MDNAQCGVKYYLQMRTLIRKNAFMPAWVAGGAAEKIVFRRLDEEPNLIQSKRVQHILDLIAGLEENKGRLLGYYAFTQLREPLKRYKWRYALALGTGLSVFDSPAGEMSEADEWEHWAVRFLLSLVPRDIHRLRRCAYDGCKGWFFAAKRVDQKFCKRGVCRQNYYDSDTEQRERKKAKMRENRKWHKEDKQRAKARLGSEGKQKPGKSRARAENPYAD